MPALQLVAETPEKTSVLSGIVRNSLGRPIAYATVYVDAGAVTTADDSGHFVLKNVPIGNTLFGVRRLGFGPLSFSIEMPADTTVHVSIRMHQIIARLREITVEEKRGSMALYRAGFYDRQKNAAGYFLLPTDVVDRAPRSVEELAYGIPGVTVSSSGGKPVVYGWGAGGYCRMSVFLDGRRYQLKGESQISIGAHDIKAVEFYPRSVDTPAQFQDPDNLRCGSMVFWTKVD